MAHGQGDGDGCPPHHPLLREDYNLADLEKALGIRLAFSFQVTDHGTTPQGPLQAFLVTNPQRSSLVMMRSGGRYRSQGGTDLKLRGRIRRSDQRQTWASSRSACPPIRVRLYGKQAGKP